MIPALTALVREHDPTASVLELAHTIPDHGPIRHEKSIAKFFRITQAGRQNNLLYVGSFLHTNNHFRPYFIFPESMYGYQPLAVWTQAAQGHKINFYKILILRANNYNQIFDHFEPRSVPVRGIDSLRIDSTT